MVVVFVYDSFAANFEALIEATNEYERWPECGLQNYSDNKWEFAAVKLVMIASFASAW